MRVEPIIESLNLPVSCLEKPELLVPTFRIREFREVVADKTGLPNIVLDATRHLQLADLGSFGRAIMQTPTAFRALVEFCNLTNTETSSASARLQSSEHGVWFSHYQKETKSDQWNSELYMLIWMLKTARLSVPDWSPDYLFVNSSESPERIVAINELGIERVTFGAKRTAFAIPHSMLTMPLQTERVEPAIRNAERQKMIDTRPSTSYSESLRQVLASYDTKPWSPIAQVAELAGVSVRTLQRRLSDEGMAFSSFVDKSRFTVASSLLESTDAKLAEIAIELGYSSQANFSRAFSRWVGVSPGEFRRQRIR